MLQNIRDKMQGQKWLTYTVLGALALVFALWGAYGIVDTGFSGGNYAAKVNGEEISVNEFTETWQRQQPQLLQAFGGTLTDAQRSEFQARLLDSAVQSLASTQHARKVGFRVTDAQVVQAFQSEEAFHVDGKFNLQAAQARLASVGYTEQAYVNELRKSLLSNQLLGVIGASDFLTPAETRRLLGLLDEEREVRFLLLQPEAFAGTAPVAEDAIEAWYKANPEQYTLPESVRLAYAELTLADVAASVSVTDAQLQERYEKNKASYVQPETRKAAHILVAVDDTMTDEKASALAKDIVQKIRAGGDFAALAREYSKDPGSAARGGELEWAGREVYVKAFSDQLFSMQQGQVSDPVKTEFGYHIIRLDGVREAAGRSFDDVRAELAASLRNELAITQFGTVQDQIQERLERAGTNLDQLVQEFRLRRGEVPVFERGAGGLPLGSDAELNREVFAEASLSQRRVGGPVPLGEDRVAIFQVQDHQPSRLRPLAEVRADVVARVLAERGSQAALTAANEAVARLGSGATFEQVAAGLRLKPEPARFVGRATPDLPVEVRDAAFAAARPEAGKPFRTALKTDGGAVALLEVTAARVSSLSDNPQLQQLRSQRELQRYTQRDIEAYLADVVRGAKVQKNLQAVLP